MRAKIAGYEAWGNNLAGTISSLLSTASKQQQLEHYVLVDVYHCILNDGEQAVRVDCFDPIRIAAALLHEQDRRLHQDVTEPFPLDIATIEFYLQRPDKRFTPQIAELTSQLTLAVLTKAVLLSLSDEPGSAPGPAGTPVHHHAQGSPVPQLQSSTPPPLRLNASLNTPSRALSPGASSALRRQTPRGASNANTSSSSAQRPGADLGQPYVRWLEENKQQNRNAKRTPTIADAFTPPPQKSPFRPAARSRGAGLASSPAAAPSGSSTPRSGAAAKRAVDPYDPSLASHHNKSIVEALKDSPIVADEYLSMAIMMHLPIKFGAHYNRGARAAIRKVASPHGLFVQPIHRNIQQSWTAQDVHVGELHVLFLPFHKISAERVEQEIGSVERHLQEISRLLVTTPSSQRTRRWFLHDMVNYILPKTELVLRDFLELVHRFGAEDVVYQMGIVRLIDEGKQGKDDMFQSAVDQADLAMPREILRFSGGAFRDVLHSGNIVYAVQQLRRHYYDENGGVREPLPDDGTGMDHDGQPVAGGTYSTLIDIDREIQKLERRHQQDNYHDDLEEQAAMDDDVESEYGADPDDAPPSGSKPTGLHNYTGGGGGGEASLPAHLRHKLQQLTADDDDEEYTRSMANEVDRKKQLTDLDRLYAAEN